MHSNRGTPPLRPGGQTMASQLRYTRPRLIARAIRPLALAGIVLALRPAPSAAAGFNLGVREDYVAANNPNATVIRDLNGDGKPDMIVVCSGNISVFLGAGGGHFGLRTDFPITRGAFSL